MCCTIEVVENFLPLLIYVCLDNAFSRSGYWEFHHFWEGWSTGRLYTWNRGYPHLLTPSVFSRHFGTCLMTTFVFCLLPETSKGRWKFHLVLILILQSGTFFLDSFKCSGRVYTVAVLLMFPLCNYVLLKAVSPNVLCYWNKTTVLSMKNFHD